MIDTRRPMAIETLDCAGKCLNLRKPQVMGVINLTPDSFYAPSRLQQPDQIYQRALSMVTEGATIIDVGGEATGPGAQPVSLQQELDRVIPVVELLAQELSVPISVDTSQAQVMREAIAVGAGLINDVRALRLPGAMEVIAQSSVPVCLMHMAYPDITQAPAQVAGRHDVLPSVIDFLQQRIAACEQAGIARQRLVLDPGFGNGSFGKSTAQNLHLLQQLSRLHVLGLPLLVGLSRKTFIGDVLHCPPDARLAGSIALHVFAWLQGASVIRTHDVRATVDALTVVQAVLEEDIA